MIKNNLAICQKCGIKILSYSAMRKWCIACRDKIRLEQAKQRKIRKKNLKTTTGMSKISRKTN
ncbi:hypothetical protein JW851_04040 [Candidatus Woesearchaeota archaeon]|nr:hypothetical protein [Candidatus Woesearchaeota archaeon]